MNLARFLAAAVVVGGCVVGVTLVAQQRAAAPASSPAPPSLPGPDSKYEPSRDAAKDIQNAVAEAKRTNRRVILDVGGEWCPWCHTLDRYYMEHKDLAETRDRLYVWIKVNYSFENAQSRNEAVLSKYPKIPGYPHLFVLDGDGKLVKSQDTSELEEGQSYNYDRMQQFLLRWAPGK